MKIAFIGQEISPSTIAETQKYVEQVSLCMAKMGHEIYIYDGVVDLIEKNDGKLKIKHIFSQNFFSKHLGEGLKIFFATLHAIFADYDVVHYQSQKTFFWSKILAKIQPHTKIVASFDLLCEFKNKPAPSLKITKEVKEILKYNLRSKRFALFAGTLTKDSGAHYLIEAFKYLEDTATTPNNFKLVLLQNGERDEEYVKYLHTLSENRSNIILLKGGNKKLMQQLFSHAYLFVESSESLSSPSELLLQAMSYGLAPIVSNIEENLEMVGEAGFKFVSKSVNNLREQLAFLLSRNDQVEQMGKLAKAKIEKEYSWETIAQKSIENN